MIATAKERKALDCHKCQFQDRGAWLRMRGQSPWLGGSDAPTVWGVGWSSPYARFCEMSGLAERDDSPSYAMRRGTLMEPVVIEMFSTATGLTASPAGENPYVVYSSDDERPWFRCTPDSLVTVPESWDPFDGGLDSFGNPPPLPLDEMRLTTGLLQVKSLAGGFRMYEWDARPPLKYAVQCVHELMAADAPWGVLAVDFGHDCRWAWTARNAGFEAKHMAKCEAFWGAVQEKAWTAALDESQATYDALQAQYEASKQDPPDALHLDTDCTKWVRQYDKAQRAETEAKGLKTEARNNLCAMMGERTLAITPAGRKITWSEGSRGRTFRLSKEKKA